MQQCSRIPFDFLKGLLGGDTLLIDCTIANNGLTLQAKALPDTGADAYLLVSVRFAAKLSKYLQLERLYGFEPATVAGYDGKAKQIVDLALRGHFRVQKRTVWNAPLLVLDMKHDVIIGKKYFERHDVLVDSRRKRLLYPESWKAEHLTRDIPMDEAGNLLQNPAYNADVEARDRKFEIEDKRRRDGRMSQERQNERAGISKQIRSRIAELEDVKPEKVSVKGEGTPTRMVILRPTRRSRHDATGEITRNVNKMNKELDEDLGYQRAEPPKPYIPVRLRPTEEPVQRDSIGPYEMRRDTMGWYKYRPIQIQTIGIHAFNVVLRGEDCQGHGITTLAEIDRVIEQKRSELLSEDEQELREAAIRLVPKQHQEYLDVFSKVASNEMPPHRLGVDHHIETTEDPAKALGYSALYKMTLEEAEACRKYIQESLDKGFIEATMAPWAAPVLFARKGDGSLRFCVDYRKLNSITQKDRYPLPLIDETLTRLTKAKIFTKIDIRQAFHRIRMAEGDEKLTAFRTRYGAYQYKVLPFGLTNGPSTFQRFINNTLHDYLDIFCTAYIDDILIYSDNEIEHQDHVNKVLARLREAGLQADLKKCEFYVTRTKFLGFIISTGGIEVDPDKVEVIRNWKPPHTEGKAILRGVRSFLGFCNFYRRFIEGYSRIAQPLNRLTCAGADLTWTQECEEAFEELKSRLTNAPLLRHFSFDAETRMETDASNGVAAGVLSQRDSPEDPWQPVAYYSEALHGAELNYGIHDKELLAVMKGLLCWRTELVGLQNAKPFTILTDHSALEYFTVKKVLNLRQVGWAETLAGYNFVITYRPGSRNTLADILSRPTGELKNQKQRIEEQRTMQLFQPVSSTLSCIAEDTTEICVLGNWEIPPLSGMVLTDVVLAANRNDTSLDGYRERARSGEDEDWTMLGDLLLHKQRLVVPDTDNLRTRVIEEAHGRLATAHPGRGKTRKLVSQRYWWPKLHGDVDRYVANCPCRAAKAPRDKTPGKLTPLPVPDHPWQTLVIDFKSQPKDRWGYDMVFVIVDSLSKICWSIPCKSTATAKDAAEMYYNGPFRILGWPDAFVSDQGAQFISAFTNELSRIHGVQLRFASAGHKPTAGQAEIMNQYLDQRMRPFVNHHQDDWSRAMPAMDHAQAALPHESLGGLSPREVLTGRPMKMTFDWESRTKGLHRLPPRERLLRKEAQEFAERVHQYVEVARHHLHQSQQRMIDQANKHRRDPDFGVGDYVYIIKKPGTMTDRPGDKLDYPLTREFYRIEAVRPDNPNTFKLGLPASWRGDRWFHADRLRKHPNNPLPGQDLERPGGDVVNPDVPDEEEWEVDEILSSRISRHKLQYKVAWKGWDPDDNWYPASDFKNAPVKLKEYHERNPTQAGPPMRLQEWLDAATGDRFDPPHPDDDKSQSTRTGRPMRRRR